MHRIRPKKMMLQKRMLRRKEKKRKKRKPKKSWMNMEDHSLIPKRTM